MLDNDFSVVIHSMKTGNCMSSDRARSIVFPKLWEVVATTNHNLYQIALAFREVNEAAYGTNHWALVCEQRNNRITLTKLANLVDQMALAEDLCVFELGYSCPDQLRRYDACLRATMPLAYANGMDRDLLLIAEHAHEKLWQIKNEVTLHFDGLS